MWRNGWLQCCSNQRGFSIHDTCWLHRSLFENNSLAKSRRSARGINLVDSPTSAFHCLSPQQADWSRTLIWRKSSNIVSYHHLHSCLFGQDEVIQNRFNKIDLNNLYTYHKNLYDYPVFLMHHHDSPVHGFPYQQIWFTIGGAAIGRRIDEANTRNQRSQTAFADIRAHDPCYRHLCGAGHGANHRSISVALLSLCYSDSLSSGNWNHSPCKQTRVW